MLFVLIQNLKTRFVGLNICKCSGIKIILKLAHFYINTIVLSSLFLGRTLFSGNSKTMKFVNILILLSSIPSVLSAGHEEYYSDDAHDILRQESIKDVDSDMVDEVALLASNETDVEEDMLTQIASEVMNMTVTSDLH